MIRPTRPRVMPHPTDPSLALVPLTRGYFAVISAVDIAAVGQFHWNARVGSHDRTHYATRAARQPNGRTTTKQLHRLIATEMGIPMDALIDHVNGNGLDCRRSNLRRATPAQNSMNSRLNKNNPTGVKGVHPHRARRTGSLRFIARIMVDRKAIFLGSFSTVEEAAAVVAAARVRLHGAFANHGEHRA